MEANDSGQELRRGLECPERNFVEFAGKRPANSLPSKERERLFFFLTKLLVYLDMSKQVSWLTKQSFVTRYDGGIQSICSVKRKTRLSWTDEVEEDRPKIEMSSKAEMSFFLYDDTFRGKIIDRDRLSVTVVLHKRSHTCNFNLLITRTDN